MKRFFRCPIVHGAWSMIVVVAVGSTHGADIAPSSLEAANLIGDLAVMNDLEPLENGFAARRQDRFVSARPAAPLGEVKTELRASVPAVNRSRTLVGGAAVFANSTAVLPLLVGDMEPLISPVSRPMSASPVGVRPSLPLLNRVPLTRVTSTGLSAE